jgi:hypothetical protein
MGSAISQNTLLRAMGSLRLSLWLLAAQLLLFLAGALQMPLMEAYKSMNSMPLFRWMLKAPAAASWWLWASMAVMALLALNTIVCGAESLLKKGAGRSWLQVLPPQAIHLGFLLMMAGHLVSSAGAMHLTGSMREGSAFKLPDGNIMLLRKVDMDISPKGYPLDWSASLEYYSPEGNLIKRDVSAPNRPSFLGGLGVYVKQAAYGGALMEVHREPGTPWALSGGALFTLGTIALIGLKVQRER